MESQGNSWARNRREINRQGVLISSCVAFGSQEFPPTQWTSHLALMQVKHHDSKLKADNYWTCQLYFAGVMAAEEGLFAQFHQPLPWNKTNKVLFSLFPVWPLQWPFAWNSVPTALPSVLCTLLEWSSQTQAEPRPTVLKILHWPLITGLIPFLKEVSSEDWSLFCLNMEHVIGRLASSFWWWCFLFVCLLFLSRARDGSLSVGNPFVLSDHYGSDL